MVEILQVLEGLAYLGFIAGAIFAVMELRTMSRDRQTELLTRVAEYTCSREMEEMGAKFMRANFRTPEEAEEQLTLAELMMAADYNDYLGLLAKKRLVPLDAVIDMFNFEYIWDKLRVWARTPYTVDSRKEEYKPLYPNLEWIAGEQRKRRLAMEQKAKGA